MSHTAALLQTQFCASHELLRPLLLPDSGLAYPIGLSTSLPW